ncbi:MAG: YihY/virulence factor BrkB family protein [Hyphomicrobiales bacterium]|nr:YihY/virulence factor BrkB family protein [Hyphomicrobiales bacterium]
MPKPPRIFSIGWDAFNRFSEDDGWAIASHIALSTLTSLFPFLSFVGALAGLFGSPTLAASATKLLFDAWPAQVAAPIAAEVMNVLNEPRKGVAAVSALLAIYFASSGVEALRIGLNRAYNVRDRRAWWVLRLESILYVLVGSVALIAFAFLVVFAPLIWNRVVQYAPHLAGLSELVFITRVALISAILFGTLVIAHKFLVDGDRSFREIMPGVLVTIALWLLFGEGFGVYLQNFAQNYISTYAGLSSAMIAIVFLYMLGAIFIFGAEINAAIAARRTPAPNNQA